MGLRARRAAARASPTLPSPANLEILVWFAYLGSGNVAGRRPLGASFYPDISVSTPGPPAGGRILIKMSFGQKKKQKPRHESQEKLDQLFKFFHLSSSCRSYPFKEIKKALLPDLEVSATVTSLLMKTPSPVGLFRQKARARLVRKAF